MSKTIRLNKVLRELNISIDRVSDFLSSKGYTIEKRPTTKISQELYDLLCNEFHVDADKKIASQEAVEAKNKEKQELREKQENLALKLRKDSEVIRASSKVVQFKKLGKIDLEKKSSETNDSKIDEKNQVDKPSVITAKKDNYKTLSGLKSTGETIDLDKFKKNDQSKVEPKSKRKRKRILSKGIESNPKGLITPKRKFKDKPKNINKEEPSEEEVQQQIKETLEKLQGKTSKGKAAKYRKDKRDQHKLKSEEELAEIEKASKTLKVTEFVTANELASMMDVSTTEIISACMTLGMMVTLNQRLDAETLSIVAEEFGYKVEFTTAEIEEEIEEIEHNPEDLIVRPAIVTVMGHVDHGKTSLLDYIRKENVIAGESGGITQHIGAYSVELPNGEKITFLDTPGHEAFTAMRARGAQVTDLVVIVIAADDDIMPQTKEAISHAQAAGVPIVIAINKIDKPDANPDKVKESLSNMNLLVEDWGGKIQSQDISALKGDGVNELLEKVLLEAELLELKANPIIDASGSVIEALLDKGRGYVSTVLVQSGTLKVGDFVLAGKNSGKVKAMQDERGNEVKSAGPSVPVSILGLDGAPQAGDKFSVYKDEREAKQIATKRDQLQREQTVRTQKQLTLDEIGRRIAIGEFKEFNIILKGDVDGSVEALTDSFQKLSTEEIQVNIIHKAVGAITESDVLLASASDAIVIGFNVRPMGNARQIADKEQIDIRTYSIIYDAINDIKDAMEGMLSPDFKEEITGYCEIRETFKISKIGTIAGCMVTKGKILRNSEIRLIREGIVIYTGVLSSLKRFKDDVKEVSKGYDCGLQVKDYKDLKIGDQIEAFVNVAIKKKI
ncbi:MAG: translation initiation factor IF-2 [Flavobacteriaceae bacterium]|tara:strand:- start:53 stop:2584 length:2532 start_codon:yes stop_codon:yes gene_type:complete